MRKWTSAAFLVGLAVVALGAWQGTTVLPGDVRIDGANGINLTDEQGITITAPAVGERTLRRYLEATGDWVGAGIADIATDFLTANQSTMMSTPVTFLSASVTVPEQGDTVIVSVSGRWAWMGAGLFVADSVNPDSVWTCTLTLTCTEAVLPSGVTDVQGITASGGMLYVADPNPASVWTCTLTLTCTEADLPSGVVIRGITASGGMLYIAANPASVWTCTLTLTCTEAVLPSGVTDVQGITASGGMLYIADTGTPDSVWTCTLALTCTEAVLPSDFGQPAGITHSGGMLYIAEDPDSVWTCTLTLTCTEALLPSGFGIVRGITASGDAPCEWRIVRDAIELESIDLNQGAPAMLLDGLTVIDRPAAGTYTYAAQMSTSTPETVCTAYQGGGVTPLPTLTVQVLFGGNP